MDERIASAFHLLPNYLAQHVILSAAALGLGIVLSLPLALLAARNSRVRWPVLVVASLVQTIPSIALLALFYPLLLGLSTLTVAAFGLDFPALGFLPSLLALTLYSMLPILRNGVAGLTGVDPAVVEAAKGVGMTPRQRLFRVEAPLAAPVIMAGVRTAAVWTIGTATLATPVGQTTLGNYIFSGLQTENWINVLFGCVAAALLALVVDQLLGLIEIGAARRDLKRIVVGLALLGAGTGAALAPNVTRGGTDYVVGAKNFSEQFILADLIAARLRRAGYSVAKKEGLGSAVAFRALASGDVDVYVDYTGTLWENVMNRRDVPSREDMLREVTQWMRQHYGITVLGPLGFENAYALAMTHDRAAALGIRSITDLAVHAPSLVLGSDLEFLSRPEWTELKDAYDLNFKARRTYNPTFMYRALENGTVDVISAFSSDGRIAADNLTVLSDPKNAIPSYDAVLLIAPGHAHDTALRKILQPLVGAISVEHMREANYMVDRDRGKKSPAQAARFLAGAAKLPARVQ
jgi:osmoprotectant transport system permease protein